METSLSAVDGTVEASTPAVSWAAIFAGTAAAVAATLILVALGSGLGLASGSPWANAGATAATLSTLAAIWLIVVQWIASGVGGYLTGRLRTRWVGTHTHEVFFRDTAHGFVTWAIASLVLATLVASATSAAVGAGFHAGAKVASGAAQGATQGATNSLQGGGTTLGGYDVDMLFRSAHPDASASSTDAHAEATRILTKGLAAGDVPADDRTYLATQIAARAGISQDEAQKRVDGVIEQVKAADVKAREAADAARKAAATTATLTALSMLIGAFIACAAAALGGRERDLHS
jgi:hypothetical protein